MYHKSHEEKEHLKRTEKEDGRILVFKNDIFYVNAYFIVQRLRNTSTRTKSRKIYSKETKIVVLSIETSRKY